MDTETLLQKIGLGEDQDIEFKSAMGGLPGSLWETLSAFANMDGGTIVLGVSEADECEYEITGVRGPRRLLKSFWDEHNNPKKLSSPVCATTDARIVPIADKNLIVIDVPRAERVRRPVFINNNPVTGTFKRNFEGDYHCTKSELHQMFRDASEETQDGGILVHFGVDDLDVETLQVFRNRFDGHNHDHPFLKLQDTEYLRAIGAWGLDAETQREGPTLAGMLMLGREFSLSRALPAYHVDYQEQKSDDPDVRWTHRITTDGRWEANLFNFYSRVILKLVEDVDVPFKLDKDLVRVEDTHVHQALREALVNCLVHADHRSPLSITVIKRRQAFVFRNPGRLRISRRQLYRGGVSSVRNANLQKMFRLLGLGEKSGAGFQKILRAWREQHWLIPLVEESSDSEFTTITMPIASMIPETVERELRGLVGNAFSSLDELDRVILMLAHRFGEVSNTDIQPFRREHSDDIRDRLKRMVLLGWLMREGWGRGTVYSWPRRNLDLPDIHFDSPHLVTDSPHLVTDSPHLASDSPPTGEKSPHLNENPLARPTDSSHLLEALQEPGLQRIARSVADRGKVSTEEIRKAIRKLCAGRFLTTRELADLLNRTAPNLRDRHVLPMVAEGLLKLRYPQAPNRPDQAYATAD